jgi:hypothetical protein
LGSDAPQVWFLRIHSFGQGSVSAEPDRSAHQKLRESECSELEAAVAVKVIFPKSLLAALTERCVEWGPAAALRRLLPVVIRDVPIHKVKPLFLVVEAPSSVLFVHGPYV